MTTPAPPPEDAPGAPRPALAPPLRRAAYRPLSWRNPWTLMLGALAAFQAGVITTLLWTSGSSDKATSTAEPVVAPAPAPVASAPVPPPAATARPAPAPVPAPRAAPAEPPRRKPPREPAAPPAPEAPAPAEPAAPSGLVEVDVTSEPEGATVKIAGAVWGLTPLTALLPARTVHIELELEGYAPARLRWSPNQKRSLRTVLTPLETP